MAAIKPPIVYPLEFYLIVFFVPAMMFIGGLVFLFKKDWMWKFTEWMLRYVNPQRTPEWERSATQRGWILVIGSILTVLYILYKMQ